MDDKLFAMIPRRKSFHTFNSEMHLSADELAAVESRIGELIPLEPSIQTAIRIVAREETNCKTGEYCVLFYSESKEYALYNAGYMLEQLDLWLVSQNIGTCWYGMSRPKQKTYQGLPFVIMLVTKVSYYNRIDIGIFLLFLTLSLREKNLAFDIKLLSDASEGQENHIARIEIRR